MGNEASLEGEGAEGAADGGSRGPASIPAGVQEDLSRLSEEERKQIAAVMARAQQGPPGAEPPPMPKHALAASGEDRQFHDKLCIIFVTVADTDWVISANEAFSLPVSYALLFVVSVETIQVRGPCEGGCNICEGGCNICPSKAQSY
uniref:Uncharacterized protein n=1 Tax=Sphaerodactylus townsendi TaxID=933632 RepID=A0ACB8FRP3_9SAUR